MRLLLILVTGAIAFGAVNAVAEKVRPPAGALLTEDGDTVAVTAAARTAGLTYAPDVPPAERGWIREALARARPEAAALLAEVDGMVTLGVLPPTGDGTLGVTAGDRRGFTIDLAFSRLNADREMDRATVVLHEFGHVVDFALVDEETGAQLDAQIPRGGPCGLAAGCDMREERFADTFAKWALRGVVSAAGAGYGVPAPVSIETWGAPLAALAVALPR